MSYSGLQKNQCRPVCIVTDFLPLHRLSKEGCHWTALHIKHELIGQKIAILIGLATRNVTVFNPVTPSPCDTRVIFVLELINLIINTITLYNGTSCLFGLMFKHIQMQLSRLIII